MELMYAQQVSSILKYQSMNKEWKKKKNLNKKKRKKSEI